jgi:hypothetical protein
MLKRFLIATISVFIAEGFSAHLVSATTAMMSDPLLFACSVTNVLEGDYTFEIDVNDEQPEFFTQSMSEGSELKKLAF